MLHAQGRRCQNLRLALKPTAMRYAPPQFIQLMPDRLLIIRLTIASPNPVPPGLPEQNGWVNRGKSSAGMGVPPL